MKLTNEMVNAIKNNDLFYVATCSNKQVPNVVPIKCLKWIGDNKVLVANNFMKKTIENISNNANVSFVVNEVRKYPFQFKGKVKVYTKDEYYEEAKKMVEKYTPKSALVIKINEVYSVNSKDKPGELILK